jgi:hypothetical protein
LELFGWWWNCNGTRGRHLRRDGRRDCSPGCHNLGRGCRSRGTRSTISMLKAPKVIRRLFEFNLDVSFKRRQISRTRHPASNLIPTRICQAHGCTSRDAGRKPEDGTVLENNYSPAFLLSRLRRSGGAALLATRQTPHGDWHIQTDRIGWGTLGWGAPRIHWSRVGLCGGC